MSIKTVWFLVMAGLVYYGAFSFGWQYARIHDCTLTAAENAEDLTFTEDGDRLRISSSTGVAEALGRALSEGDLRLACGDPEIVIDMRTGYTTYVRPCVEPQR